MSSLAHSWHMSKERSSKSKSHLRRYKPTWFLKKRQCMSKRDRYMTEEVVVEDKVEVKWVS
jgi:hypothetical protein